MARRIGIIGYGNMGSCLAQGLKKDYEIAVFDKERLKTIDAGGVNVAASVLDLVKNSEALVLAVKPQDFQALLDELKGRLSNKLLISIAAGITTAYIEGILGEARVIRVMPNIGARLRESQTCLSKGRYADNQDLYFTNSVFMLIGRTWLIEESLMNAATAICGSGPAYIFFDMEQSGCGYKNPQISEEVIIRYIRALTIAAQSVGFDEGLAAELAASVTAASIRLVEETGLSPQELRRQVTSKGGTTEVAIKVLAGGGSWSEAALAAKQRAKDLSK